ncbi:RDD family protein [Pseudomonadota bacterium]
MVKNSFENPSSAPAGLARRLGALFYDLCLLTGIIFFAGLPLPYLSNTPIDATLLKSLTQVYLLGVIFLFFAWFWTHGGQTLGMRAWKIKLITKNNTQVSWKIAFYRFCTGILTLCSGGLGYIWMLVDKEGCTWQDRLSSTRFIRLNTD